MRLTAKKQQGTPLFEHDDPERHLWRVNWRQLGYPFCGIYAISPDNQWPTKIGISQNPVKRLISLQNACWRRLDIVEYRYCANFAEAREVERKAHEILVGDSKLLNSEWFDVRPEKALEVIEFAALAVGVELRNDVPDDRIKKAIAEYCRQFNREAHIRMHEELSALTSINVVKG